MMASHHAEHLGAAAEDVVQETMLAAERQGPRDPRSLRAWKLRVGRRFASRRRRGEARRRRRELATVRGPAPSAADEAQRSELLSAIAAAVAALPPPLCEAVLLPFGPGALTTTAGVAVTTKSKTLLAVAVLVLLATGTVLWFATDEAPRVTREGAATVSADLAERTHMAADDVQRSAIATAVAAELPGGACAEAMTGADGRFALALDVVRAWTCSGSVVAMHDTLADTAAFERASIGQGDEELVLALAETGRLDVKVRAGATPIADANVAIVLGGYRAGLRRRATADEHGVAATTKVTVEVRARADRTPIADAELDVLYVVDAVSVPAKVPLRLLLPPARTNAAGSAVLDCLCRGQQVCIGAAHPAWRPLDTWNEAPLEWTGQPHDEVMLDPIGVLTWQLVDGELPVPPDGTEFHILDTRAKLRDGRLRYTGSAIAGDSITAYGPGCYAVLHLSGTDPGSAMEPARVCRARRLEVELHAPAGSPLGGCQLAILGMEESYRLASADANGHAVFDELKPMVATVEWWGALNMPKLGTVDPRQGDGVLRVSLPSPRHVRALIYVGGQRGLPGSLRLRSYDCMIGPITEDAEAGTLDFAILPPPSDRKVRLRLDTSPHLSTGATELPAGNGPVEVEFRVESTLAATAAIRLPSGGPSNVKLEHFLVHANGSSWSLRGSIKAHAPRRLTGLRPGRYRLRDELSETIGPECEIVAGGSDAELTLDLSRVVGAQGRVAASPPFTHVRVEVRTRAGTVLRRCKLYGDGFFFVRASLDEPLVLVAVRGELCSAPTPWTGEAEDLVLMLPQ
jgi:hypothetical protein